MVQGLRDKQYQFFGSNRCSYTAQELGSTAAWHFVSFSGTNTLIGADGNEESQRIALVSSGNSIAEWGIGSKIQAGQIYGGESFAFDGVAISGLWLRAADNTGSQLIRVWGW